MEGKTNGGGGEEKELTIKWKLEEESTKRGRSVESLKKKKN